MKESIDEKYKNNNLSEFERKIYEYKHSQLEKAIDFIKYREGHYGDLPCPYQEFLKEFYKEKDGE